MINSNDELDIKKPTNFLSISLRNVKDLLYELTDLNFIKCWAMVLKKGGDPMPPMINYGN